MPSYVIVGASRGIGYQYLKTLSQNPSNTIVGLVRAPASTLAKVSADKLPNVHILPGDLTDVDSLNAAAKDTAKITGGVVDHLIVNGAYIPSDQLSLKPTDYIGHEAHFLRELNTSMGTNTAGFLYAVNAFLHYVKKSAIKKVVLISSGHADPEAVIICSILEAIPYALSKAAGNLLVAKYAAQFKDEGIIFLALSPGVVLTSAESMDDAPPEVHAAYEAMAVQFRRFDPNYNGPMLPEESVDMQLQVIEKLTIKNSGEFLSHHGDKQWL